eukprot:GHUV01034252.1.p1 GENE.GHUV01034252.1~~GHUV01034252.1.p1  ORF type:complete len:101 (+),score=46.50 GHUV01034252.1:631-933(+)
MELTPQELHILDVYESEEYYRERVSPELEDGTTVPADVYVWRDEYRDQLLLDQCDWDYQAFVAEHLADYLIMTKEFMEECFPDQQQQQYQQYQQQAQQQH